MSLDKLNTASVPPQQRRRRARDLTRAVVLRARDIFELYGIPPSTLSELSTHPDATRRPPSRLVMGRGGRKGMRLFPRAEFETWLASWSSDGEFAPPSRNPAAPREPKKRK